MVNVNQANRDDLLKVLSETEVEEVMLLVKDNGGQLTRDKFIQQTSLSMTRAIGIAKQFEFAPDTPVEVKVESAEKQMAPKIEKEEEDEELDPALEDLMQRMRKDLVQYVNKKVKAVEKSCTEKGESQDRKLAVHRQQIEQVENKLEKYEGRIDSIEKGSSEFIQASCKQHLVELKMKSEEQIHALEAVQLNVKTDISIFKQEKKQMEMKVLEVTQHFVNKDEYDTLRRDVSKMGEQALDTTRRVEELENRANTDTLDFIENAHLNQKMNGYDSDMRELKQSQSDLKLEVAKLERSIKDASPYADEYSPATPDQSRSRRDQPRRGNNATQGEPHVFRLTPKLPHYDGSTKWRTFLHTFDLHSRAHNWNDDAKFAAIQLCFRDKVVDYLHSQQSLGKCQTYRQLISQMAKRFERQQDPFVKRSEFYSLSQDVDESIEEWADRVLEKGVEAFAQVPEVVREDELMRRFAMGSVDKEAAQFVINSSPRNLDEAIQSMHKFKENATLIYGKKRVRAISIETEDERYIRAVTRSHQEERTPNKVHFDSSPKRFENKPINNPDTLVKTLEEGFSKLIEKMDSNHREQTQLIKESTKKNACYICGSSEHWANRCPEKARSRSNSRERNSCYKCGDSGHFARDCPRNNSMGQARAASASPMRKQEN